MWIRSQDKMYLDDIKSFWISKNYSKTKRVKIYGRMDGKDEGGIYGEYKTKKRCLEILEEIENWINEQAVVKCISRVVYQMPEK